MSDFNHEAKLTRQHYQPFVIFEIRRMTDERFDVDARRFGSGYMRHHQNIEWKHRFNLYFIYCYHTNKQLDSLISLSHLNEKMEIVEE